jgi:hypothetical protein
MGGWRLPGPAHRGLRWAAWALFGLFRLTLRFSSAIEAVVALEDAADTA